MTDDELKSRIQEIARADPRGCGPLSSIALDISVSAVREAEARAMARAKAAEAAIAELVNMDLRAALPRGPVTRERVRELLAEYPYSNRKGWGETAYFDFASKVAAEATAPLRAAVEEAITLLELQDQDEQDFIRTAGEACDMLKGALAGRPPAGEAKHAE